MAERSDQNSSANLSSPDIVVSSRKGEVLGKHTILKSDHFPGTSFNCLNLYLKAALPA